MDYETSLTPNNVVILNTYRPTLVQLTLGQLWPRTRLTQATTNSGYLAIQLIIHLLNMLVFPETELTLV